MTSTPPRPRALPVISTNVPGPLRARNQWLVWAYAFIDEKWTKPPKNAGDGSAGSSTRRSTWSSFEDAALAYESGAWDGIGLALAYDDLFFGVDLDHCLIDGELTPLARSVVERTRGWVYWEQSPSGIGLRGFGIGTLPVGRRKKDDFEIYSEGRFITVTGNVFEGCDQIGEDSTELIAEIHREQFPTSSDYARPTRSSVTPPGEDLEIVDRCRRFRSRPKFERLMMGSTVDYGGDDSAADAALLSYLLFANGGDIEQAVRIACNSGLWREKWDSRRGDTDYIRYSALRILDRMTDFYSPGGHVQTIDGEPVKLIRVRVGG